jgi:hypothetical protein
MERTIMKGMVAGGRCRGRPRKRWIQDVKEKLNMSINEVRDLTRDRESFRRAVKRVTYYDGQASWRRWCMSEEYALKEELPEYDLILVIINTLSFKYCLSSPQ